MYFRVESITNILYIRQFDH